jgi:phosphoacetylglucosamine mutase
MQKPKSFKLGILGTSFFVFLLIRPSGAALAQALADGVNAFEAELTDYQLKTTPQLHYLFRCLNTQGTNSPYGIPTEKGYYDKMATAFKQLMQGKGKPSLLTVDCANGVGAPKLAQLLEVLGNDHLDVTLVNTDIQNPKKLNYQVCPRRG